MNEKLFIPSEKINNYVKDIFILEKECDENETIILPIFADGYPGIMFQVSKKGVFLQPKNKKLSDIFLYGQTIYPIELSIQGSYRLIVFQLFFY